MKNNKNSILMIVLVFQTIFVFGQEPLVGAKDLLTNISNNYSSKVKDFSASFKWIQDDKIQTGTVLFKNPQKMRMDFSDPKGQVIVTNGYEFWVYLENMNLVLQQDLMAKEKKTEDDGKVSVVESPILINPVGFDKFIKEYAIEYHENKSLTDYTDGTKVYQFKLIKWRSSQNGFNVVYLTVQPDGLTRKVEGITAAYKKVVLEFDNYAINQGISELKFEFDKPTHANTVNNFISKQGEN